MPVFGECLECELSLQIQSLLGSKRRLVGFALLIRWSLAELQVRQGLNVADPNSIESEPSEDSRYCSTLHQPAPTRSQVQQGFSPSLSGDDVALDVKPLDSAASR